VIEVHCPCGQTFHADESQVGKKIRCPYSGHVLMIERSRPISKREQIEVESVTPSDIEPPNPVLVRLKRRLRWRYRLIVGLGAVVVVGLAVWLGGGKHQPPNEEPHTSKYAPAPVQPLSEPAPALIPPCAAGQQPRRLDSGQRVEPDTGQRGGCPLEVGNGTDGDAVVRVVWEGTDRTARFFYVRAGEKYKLGNLQPGKYEVMWETGQEWVQSCMDFLQGGAYSRFEGSLSFTMGWSKQRQQPYCEGVGVTLYAVANGNIAKAQIDRAEFLRGDSYLSAKR
jgi:DNA-directed RNA polymerase subunit RPC12/RpoP